MFIHFQNVRDCTYFLKINNTSLSADMVWLYVNVQFQVKPLIIGASLSQTKKKFSKNVCMDPPRCVPSLESLAQV